MTTAVVKWRRDCNGWHVCLLELLLLVLVSRPRVYDAIWRDRNFLQHWLSVNSLRMFLGILGDLSWVTLLHFLLVIDVANHARIHWLPSWLVYWAHLLSCTIIGTLTSVLAGERRETCLVICNALLLNFDLRVLAWLVTLFSFQLLQQHIVLRLKFLVLPIRDCFVSFLSVSYHYFLVHAWICIWYSRWGWLSRIQTCGFAYLRSIHLLLGESCSWEILRRDSILSIATALTTCVCAHLFLQSFCYIRRLPRVVLYRPWSSSLLVHGWCVNEIVLKNFTNFSFLVLDNLAHVDYQSKVWPNVIWFCPLVVHMLA